MSINEYICIERRQWTKPPSPSVGRRKPYPETTNIIRIITPYMISCMVYIRTMVVDKSSLSLLKM